MIVDIEKTTRQPEIDYDKFLIDLSEDLPEPLPLLSIGDKTLFTAGNLSAIVGAAKSRKSFLCGLLMSKFLSENETGTVVYFDTEQSLHYVLKAGRRVHKLLDWDEYLNNERLKIFKLRELSTTERLNFIKGAVNHFHPALCFVDGIVDLVLDFNSLSESTMIVDLFLKLSEINNCHICSIIHMNMGSSKARGHLGTQLTNKCESIIQVKKNNDVSEVTPGFCRNQDFESFNFRINSEGLPEYCDEVLKPKVNSKLRALFEPLLPLNVSLEFNILRDKVKDVCNLKSNRGAELKIKKGLEEGIIFKNSLGYYYYIPFSSDSDLPFPENTDNELTF